MAGTVYFCCTDLRRAAVQGHATLNGIDYLEVADLAPAELDAAEAAEYAALPASERDRLLWQRRLTVVFVNPLTGQQTAALTPAHLRIVGGERADSRNIGLTVLAKTADAVVLRASRSGDFSVYRLALVASIDDASPPTGFDPMLSTVDFSFKVECLTEFDCLPAHVCPPEDRPAIDLDYLARDYASFRRLMLDRMSALAPAWRERHAADVGVALVEVMAYVGDYLAYRQDAIATEAYLGTARRRTSIRRHARLVDYPMHDGHNARAWVHIVADSTVPAAGVLVPRVDPVTKVLTRFLTRIAGPALMTDEAAGDAIANQKPEVFEPVADLRIFERHNRLEFHTWGAVDCCLPQGATQATLSGKVATLAIGDLLALEEVAGPKTGFPDDADPAHRHVVRLTDVTFAKDPLAMPDDVTQIEWDVADALPFALCVSSTVVDAQGTSETKATAVARGNMVLADHGLTVTELLPDAVPAPALLRHRPDQDRCDPDVADPIPPRFSPVLGRRPLTHLAPHDDASPASAATRTDVGAARPRIDLETGAGAPWHVRRDLLRSAPTASDFVVEVEADDAAHLRFGDGRHGARPAPGTTFVATYRFGNGTRGNVGRGAIAHVAPAIAGIASVRNPMPATGGVDPEQIEDVRRFAPVAFLTQARAVTADDYARMAERHEQVQRAAGSFRWTGSWRTAFVTVDPLASVPPDAALAPALPVHLEPYRMAGHDVRVDTPRYVPLEIEMTACVRREYFRADVKRALLDIFSARRLPDGRTGIFHADNFSFGQPLYLSRLYAAAYEVDGVESAAVTTFQRQGTPDPLPLKAGKIEFGRLEIARLENDPSLPERGVFRISVEGGK
jgi:hypothetical protein